MTVPPPQAWSDGLWTKHFKARPVNSVTSEEVEAKLREWAEEKRWTAASRNNRLNQLSGLLSYCYGRRWIDTHPTARNRVPRLAVDNARERSLELHELVSIIEKDREAVAAHEEKCPELLSDVVMFAASTGMRLGELCGLRKADYSADTEGNGRVIVRKTKNGRPLVFPLTGAVAEMVKRRAEAGAFPGSFIFAGPAWRKDGSVVNGHPESTIKRRFHRGVLAAKLEWGRTRTGITFHSLRRTMATFAREAGMSVELIQRLGNWKDRRMVERYAMWKDATMERAAGQVASIVAAGLSAVRKSESKSESKVLTGQPQGSATEAPASVTASTAAV